jgi:hypothetical protein
MVKLHLTNRTLVPSPVARSSNFLTGIGSLAFLEKEKARRLPGAVHLVCTLPYPAWCHGVAFPASIHSNVYLVHRPAVHTFGLDFVWCHEFRRDERRLH